MNPNIDRLQPYPFERLAALLQGTAPPPGKDVIPLSIGEPRHAPPAFIVDELRNRVGELTSYPKARGIPALRDAMAAALRRRYGLREDALDAEHQVLPLTGTREGLFSLVQALVDPRRDPVVVMPNPFYQIYEGAAILAGAEPWFLNATAAGGFRPDLDAVPAGVWERCQVLVLCSPGNPTGAFLSSDDWRAAFTLADRYGFTIIADECYADIYTREDEPPVGALEVAAAIGRDDFRNLLVCHSLSKRSSVPGLRSGLVAGDAALIGPIANYRTYHGCAMPLAAQHASIAAWSDTEHVRENRRRYQTKFAAARRILSPVADVRIPAGAFYLWMEVPGGDDEHFARELYRREGLVTLPGRYLSRTTPDGNPGAGYLRVSLVPEERTCEEALTRLAAFLDHHDD